jgi:hypothetical protein
MQAETNALLLRRVAHLFPAISFCFYQQRLYDLGLPLHRIFTF